jgi:predicted CXXCH cytochrome family protein
MSRFHRLLRALAVAAACAAAPALATDAPHDESSTPKVLCSGCHKLHAAPGAGLTKQPNNFDLCSSCHNQTAENNYGFPWNSNDQAYPGARGIHHHFEGPAANPAYGAQRSNNPEVARRLSGDQLQCSACHDQHQARKEYGGEQQLSPVECASTAPACPVPASSAVSVSHVAPQVLSDPTQGASARGYLLKLATPTTFQLSNDGGRTWFGWSGSAWVPGAPDGRPFAVEVPVALNDGENVKVTFADRTFAAGESYRFYVSYSFLRTSNADDALCVDCHRPRLQNELDVRGLPGGNLPEIVMGQTDFSHPVGVVMGRDQPTDRRAPGSPGHTARYGGILDADGTMQSGQGGGGDANPSNDLRLDRHGRVWCYSCHRTHNADSNSLTVD